MATAKLKTLYRSDVTDATAQGLASQPRFSGTRIVALTQVSGTGNIIAPNWVHTARHVVTVDGNAQAGSTGTTLTFTDFSSLVNQGFYRVVLTP